MKIKKKRCNECGYEKIIWKNDEGKRYCKSCWLFKVAATNKNIKPTKQYQIPSRSTKKKKQDIEYSKLRKLYLEEHPQCQIHIKGICTHQATEIHHMYAGASRSKYYLDITTWLSGCRTCHDWVHAHPEKAKELKLLK